MRVKTVQNILLALGVILLISLLFPFLRKLNVRTIPTSLNPYSNLILALLTAILVIITGFYARVTHRMLVQMKESRQSLVRPILWANFDNPEFQASDSPGDEHKTFRTKAHISNYGKGAAVNIKTEYRIPLAWSDEYKCVMPVSTGGTGQIPFLLAPGDSFDMSVWLHTKTYDTMSRDLQYLHPTYLTARVLYEDTERNLYQLKQSYYLLRIASFDRYYLHIEAESLHVIPFDERKNVWDDSETLPDEGTVIFSRRLPWRWS